MPEAAPELIRSLTDRILRMKADQDERAEDIREIYKEAKGLGVDKTALGRLVAHIRKAEKAGDTSEVDAIFALYLEAYEASAHACAPANIVNWSDVKSASDKAA